MEHRWSPSSQCIASRMAAIAAEENNSVFGVCSLNRFEKHIPKVDIRIAVLRIVKQEESYLLSWIAGIHLEKAVIKGPSRILGPVVIITNEGFRIKLADVVVK
jgi:hypothetical protein